MQIVIDIPDDDYIKVQDGRASVNMMRKVIRNGTPLPKGHGRLIDADEYKGQKFIITKELVDEKLGQICQDEDRAKYIL